MGVIRLSHLADGDLDDIRDSILPHNPTAAVRVLDELLRVLELLGSHPEIGQQRDDLRHGVRAFSVRPYVILYRPSADGIHVVRIVHGVRDFPSMFRDN